ncbi:MAG: thermonuclease family protein [Deltaproteobacteria bacterium]|nr:thermonuclease family protein [Deltaproteobacteria bacterium]MBW1863036.1 thermonuclease family protein [Deltaproteobacteria bacterium]
MRKKFLLILLFIAFVGLSAARSPYHHVKSVYDGDTILIDTNEKVRYLGIDAPEMGYQGGSNEFMALSSKSLNSSLVGQNRVRLEFDREKRDQYGRLLAYVFLEQGDMVNGLLVKQGLAHVMVKGPGLKYFDLLLQYQRQAITQGLGIWQKGPASPERHYPGSRISYRFHRPGCRFAGRIHSKNMVRFKDCRTAFWAGFSPCSKCRP